MRFAEEILLLLLKEDTGYVVPIPEWQMSCAMAGAVLMDLAMENRIDSDLESLTVVDATPTGDELLDPTLAQIVDDAEDHAPQFWVERIAQRADAISESALDNLVELGILDFDSGGFWTLSKKVARSGRYPTVDGRPGEEIRGRIMRTLLDDEIPDPREVAIIGLVNNCGGFQALMEPEDYELAKDRIELFSGMDLIGRSIADAVRSSYRPPESMRAIRRRRLPAVSLSDMLFSKTFRSGNLPKFMAEQSRIHGPVFELRAPGRHMVILAGADSNRWLGRKGRHFLRTRDYLEEFQTQWGTARSIASMDGAEHFRMRKAVRAGNARAVVEDRLQDVFNDGRRSFRDWGVGNVLPVEMTCQRLIGEQIAQLSTSIKPSSILDDLLVYEYRALLVHVYKMLPKFMLKTPAMKRALAGIMELYAQIHSTHTPAQRAGKRRDLVDDLMELHQGDPQFLPETDLGFAFIAPLIAGHYLGSAMGFAIYEMLVNPDLTERLAAEADALFDGGDPAAGDLSRSAIDVAHRFAMETLRLHPVIPMQMRTAMNAFHFDGMEIPAYSTVAVCFPAPHFDEKYFKDPDTFDIDRYLPPREEHKQQGAYAPFGLGTHMCGGSRWTELQMAANLLLIARHLELEMVPKNYKLKLSPLPKISVNKRFRFRVKRHRHPVD